MKGSVNFDIFYLMLAEKIRLFMKVSMTTFLFVWEIFSLLSNILVERNTILNVLDYIVEFNPAVSS